VPGGHSGHDRARLLGDVVDLVQVLPELRVHLASRAIVDEHQLAHAVERALREQRFVAREIGAVFLDRGAQQAAVGAAERRPEVVYLLERGRLVFLER
jgi:hypothetical protein